LGKLQSRQLENSPHSRVSIQTFVINGFSMATLVARLFGTNNNV